MSDQVTITENNTLVTVTTDNVVNVATAQDAQTIVLPTTTSIPAALGEIRDVDLDVAPTDGQVLAFDETSNTWQPESLATVDLTPLLKVDQTIPQQGIGAFDINVKRTKILTVDAAGRGDYITIKAACDYVATQTPSSSNQWVIQVLPGYYTEAPFSIPTYCLVQGMGQTPTGNVAHCVKIQPAMPWLGGTFITLAPLAAIDNCGVFVALDAAATSNGIMLNGNGRYTRCWLQGMNNTGGIYNLKLVNGGVILQYCTISIYGSNITAVYCSDGSAIKYCWIGASIAGTDIYGVIMDEHNDDTNIYFTRFGTNSGNFFTEDVKCLDGRVHVLFTKIYNYSGDVTLDDKWCTTAMGLQEAVAATDVVSTLKGAAGQTANLLEVKDSADATLLSIGAAGKISGNAASGGNLTLESTAHATKGNILFGNSAYDEVNNRLGIGTNAPRYALDVFGTGRIRGWNFVIGDGSGSGELQILSGSTIKAKISADPSVASKLTGKGLILESGAITSIPLTLKGYAGQTSNLFEARNSSDAILFSVDADGVLHGVDPALFTRQIMFGVPGVANATAWVRVPYACTITSYELTANVAGSCVLDLWKDAYGNFPPTVADTITASSKPALSAAQKATDAILTGWTKTLAAGDYLMVKVDSASGIDFINLSLTVARS